MLHGLILFVTALVLTLLAGYAQHRLGAYALAWRAALVRAVLACAGMAWGSVTAGTVAPGGPVALAFLAGFGIVHLPAAVILFVSEQHEHSS